MHGFGLGGDGFENAAAIGRAQAEIELGIGAIDADDDLVVYRG